MVRVSPTQVVIVSKEISWPFSSWYSDLNANGIASCSSMFLCFVMGEKGTLRLI